MRIEDSPNVIKKQIRNIIRYGCGYEVKHLYKEICRESEPDRYMLYRKSLYFHRHPEVISKELAEIYFSEMKIPLNLEHPQRFTEFIQYLRLNENPYKKTELADKVTAKQWAEGIIGKEHIIPTLGVWNSFDDIEWESLPDEFVLKCNHGCGTNLVVKRKANIDMNKARRDFKEWMKMDFAWYTLELQYDGIVRKILAEQYIEQIEGGLFDYKVHCFEGKPIFVQVIDRDLKNHSGAQKFYDMAWHDLGWQFEDYPTLSYEIDKPDCMDEIIECAEKLSAEFHYVRVDLYVIDGHVKLGEMTFTPRGGYYPYRRTWTEKLDLQLGELIHL